MTKEQFLLDTVKYYTEDPNRRCMNSNTKMCSYSPEQAGKIGVSDGCAIGRTMSEENRVYADRMRIGSIDDGESYEDIFNLLPKWMQDFNDVDFLGDVQCLHDREENWTDARLSEKGKHQLEKIVSKNEMDSTLFKEYL